MTAPDLRRELIDDHEVESSEQDALGHDTIAAQVVRLVTDVRTPTNIALYGPWGSGKTGIANLVEAMIVGQGKVLRGYRFVRFDAFKFAETPLRRNFINAVATGLGVTSAKYHDELYTGVTTTKFTLPGGKLWDAIKTLLISLVSVCVVLAGIAALLAIFQDKSWVVNFTQNSRTFLLAGFPFAALLAGVLGLATKAFGSERRVDKADSDEQFESLFRSLVDDSKAERLIVFVDEIDRASPSEVVSTLDVIRTFLGVYKCVFVVAADQQVLETALSKQVRQATPADSVNPYYSSGSAYLDKVFQYQITVPPLLNQSITRYAADLVSGREGVWTNPRRDTIVSVLIPSHVRSPRRVKHLLNAFVLAHRVAVERHAAGLLDGWTEDRCAELAKLVCLQIEFPLFARSLVEVPRLPEYVRAARTNPDRWREGFPYVTPRGASLAEEYAKNDRAVDTVLDADDEDDGGDSVSSDDVREARGEQLFDYLSRTSSVRGPQRDLIFVQGVGSPFGLPSDVADRIIEASQNGQLDAVRNELAGSEPNAVFDLVLSQLRTAIGVEQRNVATVCLGLMGDGRINLATRADNLITNLSPVLADDSSLIDADTVGGLWQLTALSELPEAEQLEQSVLASPSVVQNHEVAAGLLLADPRRVAASAAEATNAMMTRFLTGPNAAEFAERLYELSSEDAAAILDVSGSMPTKVHALLQEAGAAQKRADADERAREANAALPSYQRTANAAAVTALDGDPAVMEQADLTMNALGAWANDLQAREQGEALQSLLVRLLEADDLRARSSVESHLSGSGPWSDRGRVDLLIRSMGRRATAHVAPWLRQIDPDAATPDVLVRALVKIIGELMAADDSVVASVSADLGRLVSTAPEDVRSRVNMESVEEFSTPVTSEEEAISRIGQVERIVILLSAEVLDPDRVQQSEQDDLIQTLRLEFDAPLPADSAMVDYVVSSFEHLLNSWGSGVVLPTSDDLYDALHTCAWLPVDIATKLRLKAQIRASRVEDVPSLDDVVALIEAEPSLAPEVGALWLQARRPNAQQLARLTLQLRSARSAWTNASYLSALATARGALAYGARVELVKLLLAGRFTLPAPILTAIALADLRDDDAIELVRDKLSAATNNPDRRRVVELASAIRLGNSKSRSRYISEVVLPLFAGGIESTNIALDALASLGKPFPNDMRQPVQQAARTAVRQNDRLEPRVTQVLGGLGFPTKSKGLFGLAGRKVDLGD